MSSQFSASTRISAPSAVEYVRLSQREAVLHRAEVYVGSTAAQDVTRHLFTSSARFERKSFAMSPVFLKLFDEIITNALDASVRDCDVRKISVTFAAETGEITVCNDGNGIAVLPFEDKDEKDEKEEKKTIPEVIFSSLHAGSNFRDTGKRVIGGKNGLGATLVNIWSRRFAVEIHDPTNSKTFDQVYENNMESVGEPKVQTKRGKKGLVRISFVPDYARLGLGEPASATSEQHSILSDLLRTRTLEVAAMARKGVSVEYNGSVMPNTLAKYVALLSGAEGEAVVEETFGGPTFGLSVAVTLRGEQGADCVGFVNGVSCNSGTHVRSVVDRVVKIVQEAVAKKHSKEKVKVRSNTIRDRLTFVVSATIGDPAFSSQTKEQLTTPYKSFGFSVDFSPRFIAKLCKAELLDAVHSDDFESCVSSSLKKAKPKGCGFVEKYDPALMCHKEPEKCTLILCEGDSAKALVVSGIGSQGRDYFGVFPLKGVPLNARTMSRAKVFQNAEVQNLLKILNVQPGAGGAAGEAAGGAAGESDAANLKNLRYGCVAIFSDADHDGTHIAGLVINFFSVFFPELMKREGFLKRILSPIIRVKHVRSAAEEAFLTMGDFRRWQESNAITNYSVRYLKGLGSSTSQEAKAMFRPEVYREMLLDFLYVDATTNSSLKKFFCDGQESIAARKEMIMSYDPNSAMDVKERRVTIDDFLNQDLIHFSSYSVQRAIPCLLDGCAPARRKILYYFLQCSKAASAASKGGAGGGYEKVAQAAANCAAKTNYHHGEVSLMEGVIGLAQDFVGAGNAPYLERQGQFGSRLLGGKDHAAARYIFTKASPLAHALFPAEDEALLEYREDEGKRVEPLYYVPVLPVVLLNGATGIGTGFSTHVPCYAFEQVCEMTRAFVHGREIRSCVVPGYLGFAGKVTAKDSAAGGTGSGYWTEGSFERVDSHTLRITELPIGRWTETALSDYKGMADGSSKKKGGGGLVPIAIVNRSTDMLVSIELSFPVDVGAIADDEVSRALKLKSTLSTANMYLFDSEYALKKYESIVEIVEAHGRVRRELYAKRKAQQLEVFATKCAVLEQRCSFVSLLVSGELTLKGTSKEELIRSMVEKGLGAIPATFRGVPGHEHLLSMSIAAFASENISKMREELAGLHAQLKLLEAKSPEDLWEDDIGKVEKAYAAYVREFEEKCTPIEVMAATKTAATTRRRQQQQRVATPPSVLPRSRGGKEERSNTATATTTIGESSSSGLGGGGPTPKRARGDGGDGGCIT